MLATAKFRNAGQVCVSPTRFYIQEGIYDRFVAAFTERVRKVNVGDGLLEHQSHGADGQPTPAGGHGNLHRGRRRHGAKVRTGGERHGKEGLFFQPTVISDVPVARPHHE